MKLPCVKCITLSVCRAMALQADTTKVNDVLITGNKLAMKCKPIEDFLLPYESMRLTQYFDMGQLQIVLTYLMEGIEK